MLEGMLRVVHIFFGVFVVGYYFLMVPIVLPAINKLGPGVAGPFMQMVTPILTPIMWTSLLVITGTGIAWTLTLVGGNLSQLFASGWGWAMIIGLVLTIGLAVVASSFLEPVLHRAERLGHSIQGRPPTPEEAQQLGRLAQKARMLLGVNFAFVFVIFLDMLIARYL